MPESVQIVTIVLVGTLLFLVLVAFVVISLLFYQRSQYRHMKEVGMLKHSYEQEILRASLEIREQTLHTVSQEIHDNIGQTLSLLKLNLHTVRCDDEKSAVFKLKNARDLVSKAIGDLRDLSRTLNAHYIMEEALGESIRREVGQLSRTGALKATFDMKGDPGPLAPQTKLIVFRIFQEGMNNVIRHASASQVEVALTCDARTMTLRVTDDGCGFDPGSRRSSGTGLSNMRHRAALIGASFRIDSQAGRGTCMELNIPLIHGTSEHLPGR